MGIAFITVIVASAAPVTGVTNISGSVNVGNNLGALYIDFFGTPASFCAVPGVGVPGCFNTQAVSNGNFPPPAGAAGTILDLQSPPLPVSGAANLASWITFTGGAGVVFNLTFLVPGSAVDCATLTPAQLAAPNTTCSAYFGGIASPFTLTNDATGTQTAVRMATFVDAYIGSAATGTTPYRGIFTTQVQGNLGQVLAAAATPAGFAPDGVSYSANFTPIPEPGTVALALVGFAMIGAGLYRRRSQ
jgi:hypothetical protein